MYVASNKAAMYLSVRTLSIHEYFFRDVLPCVSSIADSVVQSELGCMLDSSDLHAKCS